MARACKNWLDTFMSWTLPRSEAPESFIYWAGLFTMASAIKRGVSISNSLLGSWNAYPNLYVVFVGPPASRKTTTLNYSDELLENVPNINVAAQAMTLEVLIKRIKDTADCSMSLRIGELGTFINPSGSRMIDALCSLYDGRKNFGSDTLIRGLEFATNPCVNFFSATTPVWISNNLSETMVGGGLTSRTIFIYEDKVRRRQLFYEGLDYSYLNKLKADLTSDLVHISTAISGEFKFSDEAKGYAEEWYENNADKNLHDDQRLAGYYGRKPEHIFKLAMLIHLSYSDELIINLGDFNKALEVLSKVEKRMPMVYQSVGKNPYTNEMDNILEYINKKGSVSRKDLLARFYHAAQPNVLLDLISALLAMERIKLSNNLYTPFNGSSESSRPTTTSPLSQESLKHGQPPEG